MKSNFQGVDLTGAVFDDARLDEADFKGAILEDATFFRASLVKVILDATNLDNSDFTAADFHDSHITDISKARGVTFDRANLGGITISDSVFSQASFEGTNLSAVKAEDVSFEGGYFEGVTWKDFHGADISFKESRLVDARLDGVLFDQVSLMDVVLDRAQLIGAE